MAATFRLSLLTPASAGGVSPSWLVGAGICPTFLSCRLVVCSPATHATQVFGALRAALEFLSPVATGITRSKCWLHWTLQFGLNLCPPACGGQQHSCSLVETCRAVATFGVCHFAAAGPGWVGSLDLVSATTHVKSAVPTSLELQLLARELCVAT